MPGGRIDERVRDPQREASGEAWIAALARTRCLCPVSGKSSLWGAVALKSDGAAGRQV